MLNREAEALKPGDPVLVRELDGHRLAPAVVTGLVYTLGLQGQQHVNVEIEFPSGAVTWRAPRYLRRGAA